MFYGIVCKSSGLPDGFGVFVTSDEWIHCSKVKDDLFQEGRMVSVSKVEKILMTTNQKFLADGSVLKKIQRFSSLGEESLFLKDGEQIAAIIPRLNLIKDT